MRETRAILLDADRIRVLSPSAAEAVVAESTWNPELPDDAAASVRDALAGASQAVLVVGLGLLEIAQPQLPPLAPDLRRALLLRDADRYFPVAGAVAVAWTHGLACATSAERLARWTDSVARFCPVGAITTVVECLARANANGSWTLPAGAGEAGWVTVRAGEVVEIRRVSASHSQPGPAEDRSQARREPELGVIARGADGVLDASLDTMLLDQSLASRFARARRARWARSVAVLLLATTALGWAADRRRGRQLDEADARTNALTVAAEPARQAEARLTRASHERALLEADTNDDPAAVLERLAALLPRDAFIQRLEWDGSVWRIDGSATSTPAIVPLLDADPRLRDVRLVAASTRFMDAGRQRESFSISFRSAPPEESRGAR